MDSNGYFICKFKIGDEEYNLNKRFKYKRDAKNETTKYAYNLLISKEANTENSPQASSSGTNQQSSSAVNGNTTSGLFDSLSRRTSIASDSSDSDSSDSDSSDSDISISDNSDETII